MATRVSKGVPTHVNQTVHAHKAATKQRRLANQIATSMSIIADADVTAGISHNLRGALAATSKRDTYRYRSRFSEWGVDTGVKRRRFHTLFDANLGDEKGSLSRWLGVGWHELGHILYTPFSKKVRVHIAFNLLEDARIERLLMVDYPRMRAPISAVAAWALSRPLSAQHKNAAHYAYQYAWAAGRDYIPRVERSELRKLVDPGMAAQIDRIFQDYLRMGRKLDIPKAQTLADELLKLLRLDQVLDGEDQKSCSSDGFNNGYDPDTDGEASGSGEGTDTDITKDVGGDDLGTGPITNKASELARIKERALRDILKQVDRDEDLQEELEQLKKVLSAPGGTGRVDSTIHKSNPPKQGRRLADEVRRVAAKFNDETGKGLVRYRDSGRLRPARFEVHDDLDTAYDMWEPGLEQEMHIGLLIDVSGSMTGKNYDIVTYALEVGLDDVANVEVVYFNDGFFVAPDKNTRHSMNRKSCGGGTDPSEGLAYLHDVLSVSTAANRAVILFTDGGFNSSSTYEVCNAYVETMTREGIHVKMLGDPGAAFTDMAKYIKDAEIGKLNSVDDLPEVVLGWTKTILSKPIGG